ncbi:MAG: glycosyltransferase family 2 protein [Syntrophobacteraceae bacterium]
MAPRVSVLIPTYNYARYLSEAIESVLAQNFTDFELLIIDDNSSDDTVGIVSRYQKLDKRIVFKANERNIGMVENWNLCLSQSRGEYVKYLFADDRFCGEEALGLMVGVLDDNPGSCLVACGRQVIDSAGAQTAKWVNFPDSGFLEGSWVINRCLRFQKNLIGEPTAVMFKKGLAGTGFNPEYRQIVDLEFWFRLLETGGFAYIARPLVAFRRHDGQQTLLSKKAPILLEDTQRLLRQYVFNDQKSYIKLSRFRKIYLLYDYNYQIWRLYRQGVLAKLTARQKIACGYGWVRFLLGYPLYKLCKPVNRLLLRSAKR